MGRKSKFSKEQKIEICRRYLDGSESVSRLAEEINVNKSTVKRWIRIFKAYGDSAFMRSLQMDHIQKSLKGRL